MGFQVEADDEVDDESDDESDEVDEVDEAPPLISGCVTNRSYLFCFVCDRSMTTKRCSMFVVDCVIIFFPSLERWRRLRQGDGVEDGLRLG